MAKPMTVQIEICIGSVQSAVNAQAGGAHRVELCDNLGEGGTTPSLGMVEIVRKHLDIGVMVMIRPRGGDFLYSDDEFEIMKLNLKKLHGMGVDGVVFGCLDSKGTVDIERTAELVELAKTGGRPMSVTFHRAFDMTRDPFEALEALLALGVDRVLTSGQAQSAMLGADLIRQLQTTAGDRLIVLPAVGINATNGSEIIEKTGVKELHLGGAVRKRVRSQMAYQNRLVQMGADGRSEFDRLETSAERVREVVESVSHLA